MNTIVGVIVLFGSIIGGFIGEGGNLLAVVQPYEVLIIGGAAGGAFIVTNPFYIIKQVMGKLGVLIKGSKYKKQLYMDSLAMLFELLNKARMQGLLALESDIEDPANSPIFTKYPQLTSDHHILDFISDYLRLMVSGTMNPIEIESLMDVELETHHHESALPSEALGKVADGLPAFGIVAAVLGIVITMGSLGGDTASIGHHVAAALVGTFMGILLAYGVFAPMAGALGHEAREEGQYFICLKTTILASLQGYAPQIAIEFGRKTIYASERPGFLELEEYVKNAKASSSASS
ncbi:flagellar motor stator protein MotA [Methylogaea oryzae]|uniref:Flagellar motor protein MotA n=2 Tax=Methylogaea oryzae TaxID=1295382 RepID=A0A8D4VRT6_9GAMM|nr:flagellar motor stator protein MotA [Methylogaea oryzae]BBL72888.1 flagellar motor protein MotA [Methylogaea oryzae]